MRLGQCIRPVYILIYIDEINIIDLYGDKFKQSLYYYNVSYKSKEFNEQEYIRLLKLKYKTVLDQYINRANV